MSTCVVGPGYLLVMKFASRAATCPEAVLIARGRRSPGLKRERRDLTCGEAAQDRGTLIPAGRKTGQRLAQSAN